MGAALSSGADASSVQSTASPLQLSVALRRKLGRGATYNVKVLLRGDAMTGKTSLLRRLQGLRPTPASFDSSEQARCPPRVQEIASGRRPNLMSSLT